MLPGLQALRFFAAASVALYHAIYYALAMQAIPGGAISAAPDFLASGVTVFFVLSGFLMAKASETSGALFFLVRRALRIYPPFLLAVGLTVAAKLAIFGSFPPFDAVTALSLVPPGGQTQYPLGVEWSLVYEVFFYVVVAGLCLLPTRWLRQLFVAGWAVAIFTVNGSSPSVSTMLPSWWQIGFSYIDLAFIAGMAGWWLSARTAAVTLPLAAAGLTLFAVAHFIPAQGQWLVRYLALSLGSTLVIVAAASGPATALFSRLRPLVILGDGSYGLYLLHVPIITIALAVTPERGIGTLTAAVAAALLLGSAFGVAEFALHGILVRRLSVYFPGRRPTPPPPASATAAPASPR